MKRSLSGVMGAALLLVFGLPGWAVAQNDRPTAADAFTSVDSATPVDPTYNDVEVKWTIADAYATDCGTDAAAGENGTACAPDETPLTHFVVYYSEASGFNAANAEGSHEQAVPRGTRMESMEGEATVKGLTPDTTYYFLLAAKNGGNGGIGDTHATRLSAETDPAPRPAQVTGIGVTPGDMKLTVSWDAANPDVDANRTNHIITMYRVQYRLSQTVTNNPGDWMPTPTTFLEVSGTTTEITGLTNGLSYDVQVKAVNDATGVSENWSAQSTRSKGTPMVGTTTTPTPTPTPPTPTPPTPTPPTPTPTPTPPTPTPPTPTPPTPTTPGAPEKVVIRTSETTSTINSITFSWTTPGSGMSALVDYQLEYMVTGQSAAFTNNIGVGTGTVQAQIVPPAGNPPLKAGTTYMIRLRAQNKDQGYGPWSEYLTASTKAVPGREPSPTVSKMAPPMVEAGDKMLKVSWTEPASEKSITHYQVDYKTASAKKWMDKPINVTELNYPISGLINDTAYVVRVRAVDGADNIGAWSDNGSGTPMGMPMPTPALPLFGAFGLGAGLLAVGRARMRRQAQLRGRREQRQMTR